MHFEDELEYEHRWHRPNSVVCLSVCRSVTLVSRAKTAEPIEMSFWFRIRVGPRNHVLHGGQLCPDGKGQFRGRRACPDMPDILTWTVKKRLNRSRYRLGYGLGWVKESMY